MCAQGKIEAGDMGSKGKGQGLESRGQVLHALTPMYEQLVRHRLRC